MCKKNTKRRQITALRATFLLVSLPQVSTLKTVKINKKNFNKQIHFQIKVYFCLQSLIQLNENTVNEGIKYKVSPEHCLNIKWFVEFKLKYFESYDFPHFVLSA